MPPKYLTDPKGPIPENKMPRPGLADAQKCENVIARLSEAAR